jgi:hypothetical protein
MRALLVSDEASSASLLKVSYVVSPMSFKEMWVPFTPAITAYSQSVQNAKPNGDFMASLSLCINQIQFSLVSESITPKAIRYI